MFCCLAGNASADFPKSLQFGVFTSVLQHPRSMNGSEHQSYSCTQQQQIKAVEFAPSLPAVFSEAENPLPVPPELPTKSLPSCSFAPSYSFFPSLVKQIGKSVGKLDSVLFQKEQAACRGRGGSSGLLLPLCHLPGFISTLCSVVVLHLSKSKPHPGAFT